MPAWVRFWGTFKDDFLGFPEPNKLVGPNGREGGWGYLAGGRFRLGEREAVILTLDPAGSYYTGRSEEHTSELQSLMRISYAVFCLKKKKNQQLNREYKL